MNDSAVSDAFVFFGATGDLAYKQVFPAVQVLIKQGRLNMPVIGVAKSGWNLDQLKERARESLEKHGGVDEEAFSKLCSLLQYVDGDYGDAATFTKLKAVLGDAKRPLYYLCIPPSLFGPVIEALQKGNCIKDARVVIEKPFGHNLASAQELNRTLQSYFPEKNIFRIDHFLGKEPVQNLIYFRFANPIVEGVWNNKHIDNVQITMAENFGVEDRGKLYDGEGAVRDVVQNHMMQVIASLAMECPCGNDSEARRDQHGLLLQSVRTLTPNDIVRGQFRGYRQEPGVASDSKVETFAALRLYIDNERWSGVPFYIRAGKCLPITATEAVIRFKHPVHPVLDEPGIPKDSYYRFRLGPDQLIALGVRVKTPGEEMKGQNAELVAHKLPDKQMPPYVRLLGDAIVGDASLFAREDSVEASWRALEPVLDQATPVHEYEPNTWGPPLAGVEPEGGWYDPEAPQ